jgi:hypothetical protein
VSTSSTATDIVYLPLRLVNELKEASEKVFAYFSKCPKWCLDEALQYYKVAIQMQKEYDEEYTKEATIILKKECFRNFLLKINYFEEKLKTSKNPKNYQSRLQLELEKAIKCGKELEGSIRETQVASLEEKLRFTVNKKDVVYTNTKKTKEIFLSILYAKIFFAVEVNLGQGREERSSLIANRNGIEHGRNRTDVFFACSIWYGFLLPNRQKGKNEAAPTIRTRICSLY